MNVKTKVTHGQQGQTHRSAPTEAGGDATYDPVTHGQQGQTHRSAPTAAGDDAAYDPVTHGQQGQTHRSAPTAAGGDAAYDPVAHGQQGQAHRSAPTEAGGDATYDPVAHGQQGQTHRSAPTVAGDNMTYDPAIHHRRSIRLRGYDYSKAGAYFVTVCVQNRRCLFGDIVDGTMCVNDAGRMVGRWSHELENKFPDIQCDSWVCMPNHIHGLFVNVGADMGSPLSTVIQWFKTMTTNEYIRGVKQSYWPPCPGKLWQRNYWEHIVRNESDLNSIREYVQTNPAKWELDQLYIRAYKL